MVGALVGRGGPALYLYGNASIDTTPARASNSGSLCNQHRVVEEGECGDDRISQGEAVQSPEPCRGEQSRLIHTPEDLDRELPHQGGAPIRFGPT